MRTGVWARRHPGIGTRAQSIFAPDSFTTFSHLVVSAAMNFPRDSGVPPTGSAPSDLNRSMTSGFFRILSTSAES